MTHNKLKEKISKEFDEKIGYCTRSECVDLNDIKSFLFETIEFVLKEKADRIKYKFNGYGGTLGFTESELLSILRGEK